MLLSKHFIELTFDVVLLQKNNLMSLYETTRL